jgi:peptidyl-prolyl cis-trans isomerase D
MRLRFVLARPEDFRPADLAEQEVEAFAEVNAERIRREYERRLPELVKPEEVRARHILFTGEQSRARAAAALERIRAGEDFARLARQLSEDPATAEQGGDLGFFPRGRMLPTFEEAAFSLKPGEVSEPIETPRGVHVIRIEERREAVEQTLTDVSMDIARELLRVDRGRDRAREAADSMATAIAGGRSFEAAARDAGLRLESSGDFGWADVSIPGLGPSPELRAAAFTLSKERPAFPRVFALAEGFALVSLLERGSPAQEEIEADLERVREREEQALRARLLSVWYEGRREALAREGKLRFYPLYPQG